MIKIRIDRVTIVYDDFFSFDYTVTFDKVEMSGSYSLEDELFNGLQNKRVCEVESFLLEIIKAKVLTSLTETKK